MLLIAKLPFIALLLGIGALAVVFVRSTHWRIVLPNALINTALAFTFMGLFFPIWASLLLLSLYPGVLAAAIGLASAAHSSYLASINEPPQYVRIYPTNSVTLLLVAGVVLLGLQRAWAWREQSEAEVRALIDSAAVLAVAERSPSARQYMTTYFAKHRRASIADNDLIHVCGSVFRLAESDGVSVSAPFETGKICRTSPSYVKDSRLP